MNLNSTEKLIDKMIKEKDFDSYAVLVSKDGQERPLMSDNVNKDTYFDIASMGKVIFPFANSLKRDSYILR